MFTDEVFGPQLREYCTTLAPGNLILQYTDGLNESCNPTGDLLGFEGITLECKKYAHLGAKSLVSRLVTAEERFREGLPPSDDLTLLALGVTEPTLVERTTVGD